MNRQAYQSLKVKKEPVQVKPDKEPEPEQESEQESEPVSFGFFGSKEEE